MPHIEEALAAIVLPVSVALSGPPEKISVSLDRVGLTTGLHQTFFRASEVRNGKPAPDLFLLAADRMKATPDRCLVIEDSVPGIAGARAAGMAVLGFHGGSHCREGYAETLRAAGAAMTFDDMRQLPALIAPESGFWSLDFRTLSLYLSSLMASHAVQVP